MLSVIEKGKEVRIIVFTVKWLNYRNIYILLFLLIYMNDSNLTNKSKEKHFKPSNFMKAGLLSMLSIGAGPGYLAGKFFISDEDIKNSSSPQNYVGRGIISATTLLGVAVTPYLTQSSNTQELSKPISDEVTYSVKKTTASPAMKHLHSKVERADSELEYLANIFTSHHTYTNLLTNEGLIRNMFGTPTTQFTDSELQVTAQLGEQKGDVVACHYSFEETPSEQDIRGLDQKPSDIKVDGISIYTSLLLHPAMAKPLGVAEKQYSTVCEQTRQASLAALPEGSIDAKLAEITKQ